MYQAYYPYLYQRPGAAPPVSAHPVPRTGPFSSPFATAAHQYDRVSHAQPPGKCHQQLFYISPAKLYVRNCFAFLWLAKAGWQLSFYMVQQLIIVIFTIPHLASSWFPQLEVNLFAPPWLGKAATVKLRLLSDFNIATTFRRTTTNEICRYPRVSPILFKKFAASRVLAWMKFLAFQIFRPLSFLALFGRFGWRFEVVFGPFWSSYPYNYNPNRDKFRLGFRKEIIRSKIETNSEFVPNSIFRKHCGDSLIKKND